MSGTANTDFDAPMEEAGEHPASIRGSYNTIKRTPQSSLRYSTRLMLSFALTAVMTAAILVAVLSFVWEGQFQSYTRQNMQRVATSTAETLSSHYAEVGEWTPEVIANVTAASALSDDIGVQLVDAEGIILYDDKENRVILFWERIRAFAMLEKPFTKEEAVHGTYGFPRESHRRPPTVGELANAYRDRDAPNWEIAPYLRIRWPSRPLTEREKAFNQFIGLLTEQQFIALFYTAAPGSLPSSVSLQQLPPAQPADDCPDPADSVFYDPEDEPWDDEPREDEPWEGEPWDDELPGSLASSAA